MRISEYISYELNKQGKIKEEEIDICRYGLEIFGSTSIELISIFIIALFVGNIKETVIFFTAFIPLRIYAGGYHADTKVRCFLVSLLVYVIFTVILRTMVEEAYLLTIITGIIISFFIVLFLAPVIHINKNVNSPEKMKYKKISLTVFAVEVIIMAGLYIIHISPIYVLSFSLGQLAVTISMIAAKLKDVNQ